MKIDTKTLVERLEFLRVQSAEARAEVFHVDHFGGFKLKAFIEIHSHDGENEKGEEECWESMSVEIYGLYRISSLFGDGELARHLCSYYAGCGPIYESDLRKVIAKALMTKKEELNTPEYRAKKRASREESELGALMAPVGKTKSKSI